MENSSPVQNFDSIRETSNAIGERGEILAYKFLLKENYRIVCANFKTPVGRNRRGAIVTGEIDLVAYDENILCFIEVKTRKSDEFAAPFTAVDLRKQRQIIRTSKMYRRIFHLFETQIRYDVVSIVLPDDKNPQIELLKNYFTETKFTKKSWFKS